MAYDADFFANYAKYLRETVVRDSHDRVFYIFRDLTDGPGNVIDLGCGMGEYGRYGQYERYAGVDRVNHGFVDLFVEADYTDVDALAERLPFEPDCFVSLFSIEACVPPAQRHALYEALFRRFETVDSILTAGFEYASKAGELKVGEAGGLESFQSVEGLYDVISDVFDEIRILTRTPSTFFGPDVVEIWKVLTRR